jgi:hypothetical protein
MQADGLTAFMPLIHSFVKDNTSSLVMTVFGVWSWSTPRTLQ